MAKNITVLDCVSQASMEIGIAQAGVSQVIQSPDQDVVQMGALINAVADEVLLDEPYRTTLDEGNWLYDSAGNPKDRITSDFDVIGFDARLAIDGVKWRFLKAKGLEFGEEMRDFLSRLNKLASHANGRVLDLFDDEGRVQ